MLSLGTKAGQLGQKGPAGAELFPLETCADL